MDLTPSGNTDIFLKYSDTKGDSWSPRIAVADQLANVDRFNQWLSVDPVTGDVNVSFYDTRNDSTGQRCGVEKRRSGGSLPVAYGWAFASPPQSGLA
jgi:hypothetical protein